MADSDDAQFQARPQPTSLSLGERLRSARKARALSIEQMADALRLEEASVEALEEGKFDVLGAPVFVRGHLKRYAALVGLSSEAVLDAYRAAAPDSDAPPSISRPRIEAETVTIGPRVWWIVAAVAALGAMIAFSSRDAGQGSEHIQGQPVEVPEDPVSSPPPAVPADVVVTEVPLPAATGAGSPAGSADGPETDTAADTAAPPSGD